MRLKSVSLKNFRCFTDETIFSDQYTALVGANNAGKSAALASIDIFFRSNPKSIPITIDDFFKRLPDRELQITLTFDDLSTEALEEFNHYARAGELSFFIRATQEAGVIRASLHGARFANAAFAPFFAMSNATDKKTFYSQLGPDLKLPPWQNQSQAASSLRTYEEDHPDSNELILSDDKAFGVEGPLPRLRQFIDFVYIPAVKDAGDEATEARNTAFARLIDRAIRANLKIDERLDKIRQSAKAEIDSISSEHQKILGTLANKIESEYKKFNSAESKLHLEWGRFEGKNLQISLPLVQLEVSDDLIKNSISKFGHGTQSNYITALLMVSATYDFSDLQTVIVGCEEPELYQHPPQAKILANALQSLASNQTQVILATHSPYFITAKSFESVRVIRRTLGQRSKSYQWSIDENCALISKVKGEDPIGTKAARALLNQFLQPQMNEIFFSPAVIFVEGEEDRALIGKYFELSGRSNELLTTGANIVPVSGKGNFINALAIARGFQIPFFAVFDGDMNTTGDKSANARLNRDILAMLEFDLSKNDGILTENLAGENFCAWKDSIQDAFEDSEAWNAHKIAVSTEFGWNLSRLRKNAMVLEAALDRLHKEKPVLHLESLCSSIVECFKAKPIRTTA